MDESVVKHLEQNETASILRRARALIDRPEKWGQLGLRLRPGLCALGAIWTEAGAEKFDQAYPYIGRAVGHLDIARWNDHPSRTHAEVLVAFDRAIELAEGR